MFESHLKAVNCFGHFEYFAGELNSFCVTFFTDDDWKPSTCFNLLNGIDCFVVDAIPHHNHEDRHEIIDERKWSML